MTGPYDPSTSGFKPFPDAADIVIRSSDNDMFHCNEHLVPRRPDAVVITALEVTQLGGVTELNGVTFRAIQGHGTP